MAEIILPYQFSGSDVLAIGQVFAVEALPISGTLKGIELVSKYSFPNTAGDNIFNFAINGTDLFTGSGRLIIAQNTRTGVLTGLNIALTKNDYFAVKIDEIASGGVKTPMVLLLTVDDGLAGGGGTPGADGLSAYQVAVNDGFAGTESQWLLSLVGIDGAPGADGSSGTNGTNGTNGVGVPTGGTAAQVLSKINSTDYNTQWSSLPIEFGVACSDETTALTVSTAKAILRSPRAFRLTEARATLSTASTSGLPTVNIKKNGTTIFSTKITIDVNAKTSKTATAQAVFSATPTDFADGDEIQIDLDVAGTGAAGLKIWLIGTRL